VVGLQGGCSLVDFGSGECGLYLRGFANDFGTPLALRGPRPEVEALVAELQR